MASSFLAIALLLASRVRKDFWQPVDTVPWDKFSPDHLVGVIPDDLNFDASLFPCCPDHSPRFACLPTAASKQNALPSRTMPEKASEWLVRRRLCRKWARGYRYPDSIPHSPPEGLSIGGGPGWCQDLAASRPLVVAGRPSSPWEDYNYKSLAAVAHTPGWNGTPVAGCRGGGLSSWLRIGCVLGSRNGMFCRVLHTQVLEVIEFALS